MRNIFITSVAIFSALCVARGQNSGDMLREAKEMGTRFVDGYKQGDGHLGDKLIEGMINTATPEADENTRQIQRSAVKFAVDPSEEGSQQHFDNMKAATERLFGPSTPLHDQNAQDSSFRPAAQKQSSRTYNPSTLNGWQVGVGERNTTFPVQTPEGIRLEANGYGNCELSKYLPASIFTPGTHLDLIFTPEYSSSDSYAQFHVTVEALDVQSQPLATVYVGYGSPTSDFDRKHGFGGINGTTLQIPILGPYDGNQRRIQRNLWDDFASIPGFNPKRVRQYKVRLLQRSGWNGQTTKTTVNHFEILASHAQNTRLSTTTGFFDGTKITSWQTGVGERNTTFPEQVAEGIKLEANGYGNCELTTSLPGAIMNRSTYLDLVFTPKYSSSDSYAQFHVTLEALNAQRQLLATVYLGYGTPTSDFDRKHGFGGINGTTLQIPILGPYDGNQRRVQRNLWDDFASIPGFYPDSVHEYKVRVMQRSGWNGQSTRLIINQFRIGQP